MNQRQKRMARRGVIQGMKGQLPFLLGLTAFLVVLGLVGHQDAQTQLYEATISTCEQSYKVIDGVLEQQCGHLIDQVQADGKTEVLSQAGTFWIEVK